MANPLFNLLNPGGMGGKMGNMMQIFSMLKQNPMEVLQKSGFNVPAGLNGPSDILRYLVQSGQINQAQLNQAQQMAQMFQR